MSNLGWYQKITEWSKAVGDPKVFLGVVAGGGYVIGKVAEIGSKKAVKLLKRKRGYGIELRTFRFTVDGDNRDGLKFMSGDEFCVVASDKDSILIEKINDKNNPRFVSGTWLKGVSNYGDI